MHTKKISADTQKHLGVRRAYLFGGVLSAVMFAVTVVLLPTPVFAAGPNAGQVDVCGGGKACNAFIDKYINPVIILLTVIVGIAAVISIIVAGIQYSASADDPATVSKAKSRIFNTIIGLVAYIFLLAFFNYLVPGGLF